MRPLPTLARPALALTAGALCLALPAAAQDGPSFDCAKAASSAEELICSDTALGALDKRLSERFAAALALAGGLQTGAQAAEDRLRANQRGWIAGRDACWQADDLRACVELSYQRREAELVAMWFLETPGSTVRYLCDGTAEIALTFFDTALPGARIEYGDKVVFGTLETTGAGARYAGTSGTWVWAQGDTATAQISPGGEGPVLSCELAR